jgi:uncharacterized repeat protein (TIGR03803 family)
MDASSNLYGATQMGGKYISGGGGVVFKLSPNQDGTSWTQTILYTFCADSQCADGSVPNSLIMDAAGNLYGTTAYGGSTASNYGMGAGTIFKLMPTADGWTHTVLYNFASRLYVVDGQVPLGTLIVDSAGSLYGTTFLGGRNYEGAVFRLTPNQDGTAWTETILYSLCSQYNGNTCLDGQTPRAGLVMDEAGNLFGTTTSGGASNQGVVFQLTPNLNPAAPWAETVIHSFDSRSGDGIEPQAGLIIDQAGNLYGTNLDTVFQLSPNADHTAWTHTVLYRFCPQKPIVLRRHLATCPCDNGCRGKPLRHHLSGRKLEPRRGVCSVPVERRLDRVGALQLLCLRELHRRQEFQHRVGDG